MFIIPTLKKFGNKLKHTFFAVTKINKKCYDVHVNSKGENMKAIIMKNISHYNLGKQPHAIQKIAAEGKLPWPCFVGQGCTYHSGSDSYGNYIVAKKQIGKKTVWGIARAHEVMGPLGWTDGTMICSIDIDNAKPDCWIVASGKNKLGNPKWWFCDENGKKQNGRKCTYSWNGAYSYRDPSF